MLEERAAGSNLEHNIDIHVTRPFLRVHGTALAHDCENRFLCSQLQSKSHGYAEACKKRSWVNLHAVDAQFKLSYPLQSLQCNSDVADD